MFFQIFLMFPQRSNFPTYSYMRRALSAAGPSVQRGRWRVLRAFWAAWVMASGVRSWRPLLWLCGAVAGRGAVMLPGPVSWPGVVSSVLLSIVVGAGGALVPVVRGGGRSAVQPGRVRLLCMVPWLGPVLRSACLGCWWRCLASMRGGIMSAGAPVVAGSCSCSGLSPNCIAGFRDAWRGFSRR